MKCKGRAKSAKSVQYHDLHLTPHSLFFTGPTENVLASVFVPVSNIADSYTRVREIISMKKV
jgi:hypothetical protein